LWHDNLVEILLAGYRVVPFVLAVVLSLVGLVLELIARPATSTPVDEQR